MLRPKIKWSSLEDRIERIEKAKSSQRRMFVITAPYERTSEERLAQIYKQMREEFGYVENRDLVVILNKFFRDIEEPPEDAYQLLYHKMIK